MRSKKTVRNLARTADDLRRGKCFPVARLAAVKNLCRDPDAAAKFAREIAKLTLEKMDARRRPANMRLARWTAYQRLAADAVEGIAQFAKRRTKAKESYLCRLLWLARDAQNAHEHHRWGVVRIINCWDLLVIETAIECAPVPLGLRRPRSPARPSVCRAIRPPFRYGTGPRFGPHDRRDCELLGRILPGPWMESRDPVTVPFPRTAAAYMMRQTARAARKCVIMMEICRTGLMRPIGL